MTSASVKPTRFERQFYATLRQISRTIELNELRLEEAERRDVIKSEWQEVALVVDRLLLLVFIGMTVGITLSILLRAPHSWDFILGTGAVDASTAAVAEAAGGGGGTSRQPPGVGSTVPHLGNSSVAPTTSAMEGNYSNFSPTSV